MLCIRYLFGSLSLLTPPPEVAFQSLNLSVSTSISLQKTDFHQLPFDGTLPIFGSLLNPAIPIQIFELRFRKI